VTLRAYPTGSGLESWRVERNGVHVGDVTLTIVGRGEYRVTRWDRPDLVALRAQLVRDGTFTFRRWDATEASKVLGAAIRDAFTEETHVMTDPTTIDRLAQDHDAPTLAAALLVRLVADEKLVVAEAVRVALATAEGIIDPVPGNPHREASEK
jgi:hypothetical protein